MGTIIAIVSVVDQELTYSLATYFCKDNNKAFLLAKHALSKLKLNTKKEVLLKICETENIQGEIVDYLKKNIAKLQEIRNKVAHYQLTNSFKNGKHIDVKLMKNARFSEDTDSLELNPEFFRKINSIQKEILVKLTYINRDLRS